MRTPSFQLTMRVLQNVFLAVALGGSLMGCAAGADEAPTGGTGLTGETGGAGSSETGGAVGNGGVASGNGGVTGSTGGTQNGSGSTAGSTGGTVSAGTGGTVASTGGVTSSGTGGFSTSVNAVCSPIGNGSVTFTVNGLPRTFSVQLPADTSHMALLFLWHGWMQNPNDFANTIVYDVPAGKWVPFDPNAFPMPLMIVTPTDTKLIPPVGLDWDIVSGEKDFPFFEAMLKCIKDQYSIDESRIYSFGFSAGAVFTDLLSAKYPDLFAATISESGMWFNDQSQWSDISVPIMQWNWPAFNVADRGNVLLTHGGPNDYATVANLESANIKAVPFLHTYGRTVTECTHTFGHTLDPDLTQAMYYQWMWAHQLGGQPLSGMLPGFPTQANPVGATACFFHPYP